MSIEALLTDLTVAVRELTAALAVANVAPAQHTPASEGEQPAKRGPGRPRKNVETAPSEPTAEVAVAAAPEPKDVPSVKVAEKKLFFRDTSTGRGMVCEAGWPIPSMERLEEITEDEYIALSAPKVTPVISHDTARAKVLLARDELMQRLVKKGETPDKAKTLALDACSDMIRTVGGAEKIAQVPQENLLAVMQKAERLLADKGATAFDVPQPQPEDDF